jgi:hypothetical protein
MEEAMTYEAARERKMTLRMQVVWQVLEAAKDVGDLDVINACRRIISGDGRRTKGDLRLVLSFAE